MRAPVSIVAGSLVAAILQAASIAHAEDAEQPKGWDRTERVADYLEPAIPHPAQQQEVLARLRQLEAKTGRKPKHSHHTC
jgi:hypothetical protein